MVFVPASIGTIQVTGTALADSTATDLSDADVVGLVYLRLDGGTASECTMPPRTSLTSALGMSEIGQPLGTSNAPDGACTSHAIGRQVLLPPKEVVKLVQRFGWGAFLVAAGLMLAMMLAVGSALILRVRRFAPTTADELPAPRVAIPRSEPGRAERSAALTEPTAVNGFQPVETDRQAYPTHSADGSTQTPPPVPPEPVEVAPDAEPDVAQDPTRALPRPVHALRAEAQPVSEAAAEAPEPVVSADVASEGRRKHAQPLAVRTAQARRSLILERRPAAVPEPARSEQASRAAVGAAASAVGHWVAAAPSRFAEPFRRAPKTMPTSMPQLRRSRAAVGAAVSAVGHWVAAAPSRFAEPFRRAPKTMSASIPQRRRKSHVGRREAMRYWVHTHQEIIWAVGLGAVMAFLAGAFAGLI